MAYSFTRKLYFVFCETLALGFSHGVFPQPRRECGSGLLFRYNISGSSSNELESIGTACIYSIVYVTQLIGRK
jgi:hypothetical protein